jgi:hypothetical protein
MLIIVCMSIAMHRERVYAQEIEKVEQQQGAGVTAKYGCKYGPSMNQVHGHSKPLFFSVNQVFPQYTASTTQVCAQYTTWVILSSHLAILTSYSNFISACARRCSGCSARVRE